MAIFERTFFWLKTWLSVRESRLDFHPQTVREAQASQRNRSPIKTPPILNPLMPYLCDALAGVQGRVAASTHREIFFESC